jgi:hypothetical protein
MKRMLAVVVLILTALAPGASPSLAAATGYEPPPPHAWSDGGAHAHVSEPATAPDQASGEAPATVVLTDAGTQISWGSLVMVGILLMSFAGGAVAIIRSMRRRR